VIGTPGRLLDLAQQGHLVLGNVRILVLDEADEMLDLGFLPDIEKLMKMLPDQRQTMLFSATMPGPIVSLARTFLTQPMQIRAESDVVHTSTDHIDQFAYRAHSMDKVEVLARVLQSRGRGLTLIFVRTKRSAAKVADDLADRGFAVAAVHGDLGQGAREQALRAFRSGKVDVLVATDVAARGLDVEGITHVINYQAPEDEMTYVHRIGRTARAGASGSAVTLVDWDDVPRWKLICDKLDLPFHEPVETYSTSPHLAIDLDIPDGVTGVLPRADRTRAGLDAETLEDLGGREPKRASGPGRRERAPRERSRADRPRAERTRTRTRGGRPLEGEAAAPQAGDAPAPATREGAPRKRRRRRRPSGEAGERPTSD
jgi:superfamily II DNA/RNA helicase